jgi:hypothetical protein
MPLIIVFMEAKIIAGVYVLISEWRQATRHGFYSQRSLIFSLPTLQFPDRPDLIAVIVVISVREEISRNVKLAFNSI